jgi:hypothetical protein
MNDKACLITGCGRSGTRFIVQLLRSFGCDFRHEQRGREGSACWYCCLLFERNVNHDSLVGRCGCRFRDVRIDDQGRAISDSGNPCLRDHYSLILHQLRSPMEVIASAQTLTKGSIVYIDNKIGIRQYDDRILQAARYWVEWNKAAYRICDFSYRIEDLRRRLPEICDLVGVRRSIRGYEDLLARRTNSRPHPPVSVNHIKERDMELYRDLVETAQAFGYVV